MFGLQLDTIFETRLPLSVSGRAVSCHPMGGTGRIHFLELVSALQPVWKTHLPTFAAGLNCNGADSTRQAVSEVVET